MIDITLKLYERNEDTMNFLRIREFMIENILKLVEFSYNS